MYKLLKTLFILSTTFSCISTTDYIPFNYEKNMDSSYTQELTLEFRNFNELPLLLDVYLSNMQYNINNEITCEETSTKYHIKLSKEKIKFNFEDKKYCISVNLHYKTFRPFGKNEKSSLKLKFDSKEPCRQIAKSYSPYSEDYECAFLDFKNRSHTIVFTNTHSEITDEETTFVAWVATFLSVVKPPPYLYFTPLPMFLFGYKTIINEIKFEID